MYALLFAVVNIILARNALKNARFVWAILHIIASVFATAACARDVMFFIDDVARTLEA